MLIVDSQVHIWAASTPQRPWPARHAPHRPEPFSADDLLKEMNTAGVDAAIIVPPGWEGDRNDLGLDADVAVKATSMPHYSTEPYPHPGVQAQLKKVVDAFGPKRVFWGTDMTKLPRGAYRQAVTMFTEELPWLGKDEQEWVMGRGLCEWLGWQHPRLPRR